MKAKLYFRKTKKAALVSSSSSRKISFFVEKPSSGYFGLDSAEHQNDNLKAHDLFSLFTADIIKQEIIFIR